MFKFLKLEKTNTPLLEEQKGKEIKTNPENYGLPEIDNPQLLRLIAAIDFGNFSSPEEVDSQMETIKAMQAQAQGYNIADVLAKRAKESIGGKINDHVFYGHGGTNRYFVYPDGRVKLMTGRNIRPAPGSIEKAQELGMEILEN